jgi:hypothetical protein
MPRSASRELPLPREIQTNLDEEEYLAMKIRLLESLERCLVKHVGGEAEP